MSHHDKKTEISELSHLGFAAELRAPLCGLPLCGVYGSYALGNESVDDGSGDLIPEF